MHGGGMTKCCPSRPEAWRSWLTASVTMSAFLRPSVLMRAPAASSEPPPIRLRAGVEREGSSQVGARHQGVGRGLLGARRSACGLAHASTARHNAVSAWQHDTGIKA